MTKTQTEPVDLNGVQIPDSGDALRKMARTVAAEVEDFLREERGFGENFAEQRRRARLQLGSFGKASRQSERFWAAETTRLTGELDQSVTAAKKRLDNKIRAALKTAGIEL